jgi:putative aldouronate transport system permease protein
MSTVVQRESINTFPNLKKRKRNRIFTKTNIILYLMILPIVIYYVIFSYIPMAGVAIAFADFRISGFKAWVGFENFRKLFSLTFFWQSFWNTWIYVLFNYLLSFPAPIILALLLNEVRSNKFKKLIQTLSCLPNFVSWVVIAGIFISLLSPSTGYINTIIKAFGGQPIYFLSKPEMFPMLLTIIRIWKGVGYSTIIYLAALAAIDEELYEAAVIDGANRWKQTLHITLPGIKTTILVVLVLSFSGVLNLFEPVYVFQNPMISSTAEVLDTYTYKTGIVQGRYAMATAIGLFKSAIAFVLVIITNILSKKLTDDGKSII